MSIGNKIIIGMGLWAILLMTVLWDESKASGRNTTTINNYYPASLTIIEGVTDTELAEGLAGAAAVGSHVFLNTYDWQASITGSWSDGENAISGAIGKKWKKHPNIFLHLRYTDVLNTTVIGGTVKF